MNQHYYKVRIVNLKLISNFHRTCQPNPFELIWSNNILKIKHQHIGIWISIAPASQAEKPPGNLFPEVLPRCTWRFKVDKTRKANVDKVQCWEGLLLINLNLYAPFALGKYGKYANIENMQKCKASPCVHLTTWPPGEPPSPSFLPPWWAIVELKLKSTTKNE